MVLCRLCNSKVIPFTIYKGREYHRCPKCYLIQLLRSQCPSLEEEQREYQLHINDPYDERYRRYLQPVTNSMLEWLQKKKIQQPRILDFGSGPGPTISVVLEEQGWSVTNYDPFFSPDTSALLQRYDVISCTEVVEHFYEPKTSWEQLLALRNEQGSIIVMTQCSDSYSREETFHKWRYIREKSHVVFYHSQTMHWIAKHYGLQLSVLTPSVFVFSEDVDSL